ncbi:hypothetical protein Thini_3862 [Thiothrix nivea DSM 5205]|uniref:Uncharacterized protein n=1 Tax=Thiothrix nivea (strain ATCC 35100 / DSM 5205 / JP2) TaxID=870187 RepID=A0A656HJH8_THINJ|nr:hypothetical protein Thini_3862 [Thiothrix nivea DSM 5205]
MNAEYVRRWVREHPLSPVHVDCATAVMLIEMWRDISNAIPRRNTL